MIIFAFVLRDLISDILQLVNPVCVRHRPAWLNFNMAVKCDMAKRAISISRMTCMMLGFGESDLWHKENIRYLMPSDRCSGSIMSS